MNKQNMNDLSREAMDFVMNNCAAWCDFNGCGTKECEKMNKEQKQVTAEEVIARLRKTNSEAMDSLCETDVHTRIAELEAINSQYKKQITELNQCLSDECRYNFKLKSQRDRYREALERIGNLDWNYPVGSSSEKAYKLINTITEQALNQKEGK